MATPDDEDDKADASDKKTKKRKKKDEPEVVWDGSTSIDYLTGHLSACKVHAGAKDSATSAAVDIGIRLPHLSARYLFQRSSLPFERTVIVFGPSGTNKSALVYWLYDLYRRAGGYYLHVDAEDKDTPILRLSLTDYDEAAGTPIRCSTINEYQASIEGYLNWYKSECKKADGPGKRIPFIVGIDSLVAKLTAEAAKKIVANDGMTERRFADEARSLADWFKYIPDRLQGFPLCLAAVNHDKPKAGDSPSQVVHHSPGGTAPNFFATYRILTDRVRVMKQNAQGWEGNRIRLKMEKNSLAADKRSVDVEFVWRVRGAESRSGKTRTTIQDSLWNWDKATAELLFNLCDSETRKYHGRRGNIANEVLAVRKGSAGRYYSTPMGVPQAAAMPAADFGRHVETCRELLELVEPDLGIHRTIEYVPGRDYDEQVAAAAAQVDDLMPARSAVDANEADWEEET